MNEELESCLYQGEDRRKHCELVILDHQRMNDFLMETKEARERQEKAIAELAVAVMSINKRLDDMTKAYKVFMWGITAIVGTSLIAIVNWVFEFIKAHFN